MCRPKGKYQRLHAPIAAVSQESGHASHDHIKRSKPPCHFVTKLGLVAALGESLKEMGTMRHGPDGDLSGRVRYAKKDRAKGRREKGRRNV